MFGFTYTLDLLLPDEAAQNTLFGLKSDFSTWIGVSLTSSAASCNFT